MRARGVVVAAVVVLAIAATAVVGEAVVGTQTQRRLTNGLVTALGADPATTSVDVGGGLLLPQLARGRLDSVDMVAADVVLDQGAFTDVMAHATDVSVRPPHTAGTLAVSGIVPPETIRALIAARGLDLELAVRGDGGPDGVAHLRAWGAMLGVGWDASLVPRAADGHLLVDVVSARIGGVEVQVDALPAALRDAVSGVEVPLDGLPDGLVLRSARVVPTGVAVTLDGTKVALDAAG